MPKRICIVDDQRSLRHMIRFALQADGVELIEAENGPEALDKVAACDLNLLIIGQFPGMEGLDLVRCLRQTEAGLNLPVVLVSGRDNLEARKDARNLKVHTWLKKPLRISEIQTVVETVLDISAIHGSR